ncbi:MAG: acyltransferase family protein [Prevotella sp.]
MLRLLCPLLFFGILFSLVISWPSSVAGIAEKTWAFLMAPAKNGYWYFMALAVFYMSLYLFRLNPLSSSMRHVHEQALSADTPTQNTAVRPGRSELAIDIIIAAIIWGLFLIGWKYTAQTNDPFCLLNCGNFYPFFILGVFSRRYGLVGWLIRHNWLYTLSLVGWPMLFFADIPHGFADSIVRHILMPFFAVAVFVTIFYTRAESSSRVENILAYLGRHTLDIYAIHYFILLMIRLSTVDRWFEDSGNIFLSIIFTMALSLVVALMSAIVGQVLRLSDIFRKYILGG